MNYISWLVAAFALTFLLLARYFVAPENRGRLMTAGAILFILLQDPPHPLLRILFLLTTFAMLLIGWAAGNFLGRQTDKNGKFPFAFVVTLLLSPLVIFKLVQAIVPTHFLNIVFATRGNIDIGSLAPLGISYFTFRTLAYLIEIRRGTLQPVSFGPYLNYVAFWPTFMAGPIERPQAFLSQLGHEKPIDAEDLRVGVFRILEGLFKKLVLGSMFYHFTKPFLLLQGASVHRLDEWQAWQLWCCLIAYYLYLYCDFAGYSDIAIGVSRLFGYKIMENFRWPLLATNVADYWRRWHISLTGWIRDYVYYPLGGNRRGMRRASWNSIIAMVLVGVWHGLSVHYALFGVYHGVLLNLYRHYRKRWRKGPPSTSKAAKFAAWLGTFILIDLGFVLFLFKPRLALEIYLRLFMLH
ncbi:MAG TPA: MBOAT family O-acyltransferase [bacterium]|nr:MBOAT family O-acyltransferase [bacterium]